MSKNISYDIIHEDEDIIVVNKTPQILSIPDRYNPETTNIYHLLKDRYDDIFIVHRIDKDTSGVLLFAKNPDAHKHLNQQFEQRTTTKKYIALVKGFPVSDSGRIDAPIGPHPTKQGCMAIVNKGKEAITEYNVVEKFKNFSLVECNILTGRTHQIRVHMKHIGCPLAVDVNYGGNEALFLSEIKKRKFNIGKFVEEIPILSRVPLHAYQLTIVHPITDKKITFEAEAPKDFKAVLNQLRKWNKI